MTIHGEPGRTILRKPKVLAIAATLLCSAAIAADKTCWDYFREGDYEKAIAEFQEQIKKYPKSHELIDGLGWSYLYSGCYLEAESQFKKALEIEPDYAYSKEGIAAVSTWRWETFNSSTSYYYAQMYDEAIAVLISLESDRSGRFPREENWRIHQMLGWCYYYQGRYEEAESRFGSATKLADDPDPHRGLAYALGMLGKYDAAISAFKALEKLTKLSASDLVHLGWAYLGKGETKDATKAFKEAILSSSTFSDAHLGLGAAYSREGKFPEAKSELATAIELSPSVISNVELQGLLGARADWWELYRVLGWSWYRSGSASYALEAFRLSLARMPDDLESLTGVGFSLYALGEYDAAIIELERVLSRSSELYTFEYAPAESEEQAGYTVQANAKSVLAWALLKKGHYDTAEKHFQEVLRTNSLWVDSLSGLGWCSFYGERYDEAEMIFSRAQKIAPAYPEAASGLAAVSQWRYSGYNYALSRFDAGDFSSALAIIRQEESPDARHRAGPRVYESDLWRLHSLEGWCLVNMRRYEEACLSFQRGVAKCGGDPSYLNLGMASALYGLARYDEAVTLAEKIAEGHVLFLDALNLKAWCLVKLGKIPEALRWFAEVVSQNPSAADAYLGLAVCYKSAGNRRGALEHLQKAVSIQPLYVEREEVAGILEADEDRVSLFRSAAWSFYSSAQYTLSRDYFQKALDSLKSSRKNDKTLQEELESGKGFSCYKLGDYKTAIELLGEFPKKLPAGNGTWDSRCEAVATLAWAQYYCGEYSNSAATFKKLFDLFKANDAYPDLHAGLGWCLLKSGSYDDAEKEFLEALKLSPSQTTALEGLARVKALKALLPAEEK